MVSFTPCWMAAMAAGSATSPYGMSEASALRIVVPPPAYGMGLQPSAVAVLPVRGSLCRPEVQ